MICHCDYCESIRTKTDDSHRVKAEMQKYNVGKTFVKNGIVAEIRWIRQGIEKGWATDPKGILDFLEKRAEELAKTL